MRKQGSEFTDEFRLEVLRLVESGRTIREVAREMGVGEKSIYRWQKEFAAQKDAGTKTVKELEGEVRLLRKRAERGEMEAAILKKAISIFSTSPGKD